MSCSGLPIQNRKCGVITVHYEHGSIMTKIRALCYFLLFIVLVVVSYLVPRMPALSGNITLWEMVRLVNMLIVFRFLRIIPEIKVSSTVRMNDLFYDYVTVCSPPHANATVTSQAWIGLASCKLIYC